MQKPTVVSNSAVSSDQDLHASYKTAGDRKRNKLFRVVRRVVIPFRGTNKKMSAEAISQALARTKLQELMDALVMLETKIDEATARLQQFLRSTGNPTADQLRPYEGTLTTFKTEYERLVKLVEEYIERAVFDDFMGKYEIGYPKEDKGEGVDLDVVPKFQLPEEWSGRSLLKLEAENILATIRKKSWDMSRTIALKKKASRGHFGNSDSLKGLI
jgi:hypothetical protein